MEGLQKFHPCGDDWKQKTVKVLISEFDGNSRVLTDNKMYSEWTGKSKMNVITYNKHH